MYIRTVRIHIHRALSPRVLLFPPAATHGYHGAGLTDLACGDKQNTRIGYGLSSMSISRRFGARTDCFHYGLFASPTYYAFGGMMSIAPKGLVQLPGLASPPPPGGPGGASPSTKGKSVKAKKAIAGSCRPLHGHQPAEPPPQKKDDPLRQKKPLSARDGPSTGHQPRPASRTATASPL
jgi:hypothetical protein